MEAFTPWKWTDATHQQPLSPTKGPLLNIRQHSPGLRGLQIEWGSPPGLGVEDSPQPRAMGIPDLLMEGFSDVAFSRALGRVLSPSPAGNDSYS